VLLLKPSSQSVLSRILLSHLIRPSLSAAVVFILEVVVDSMVVGFMAGGVEDSPEAASTVVAVFMAAVVGSMAAEVWVSMEAASAAEALLMAGVEDSPIVAASIAAAFAVGQGQAPTEWAIPPTVGSVRRGACPRATAALEATEPSARSEMGRRSGIIRRIFIPL